MKLFHAAAVFSAAGDDIDARGVDIAVSQNVGKPGEILIDRVKEPREQMAQIMGKDFFGGYLRLLTKCFHFPPDIGAVNGFSALGTKDDTAFDVMQSCVAKELFSELGYDHDAPCLALAGYGSDACPRGFHRDGGQFTYADTRSADRFEKQCEALIVLALRRSDKAFIFVFAQLLFGGAKELFLHLELSHTKVIALQKSEKEIPGGKDGVGTGDGIAFEKLVFSRKYCYAIG